MQIVTVSRLARSMASGGKRVYSGCKFTCANSVRFFFSEPFKRPFFKILTKICNYVLNLAIMSQGWKYLDFFFKTFSGNMLNLSCQKR